MSSRAIKSKSLTSKVADDRKKRNIESAYRSRDRLKNEHNWMAIQLSENESRIKHLENQVARLTDELISPKPCVHTKPGIFMESDRPKWFGTPF